MQFSCMLQLADQLQSLQCSRLHMRYEHGNGESHWQVLVVQGGKAAAETAVNMQSTGDFSAASTAEYERKWIHLYGYDFPKVNTC